MTFLGNIKFVIGLMARIVIGLVISFSFMAGFIYACRHDVHPVICLMVLGGFFLVATLASIWILTWVGNQFPGTPSSFQYIFQDNRNLDVRQFDNRQQMFYQPYEGPQTTSFRQIDGD